MIRKYCTLSYGEELSKKYSEQINSSNLDITVYTNFPEYFNKKTVLYERKEFSYYEKITFLLKLVKENFSRYTYFDIDSYDLLNNNFSFSKNKVYCYKIFDLRKMKYLDINLLKNYPGVAALAGIYNQYGYELCKYPHERLISVPYLNEIDSIIKEVKNLQGIFEEIYPEGKVWKDNSLTRFAKKGCGYGEGGALAGILNKYKIKLEVFDKLNLFL